LDVLKHLLLIGLDIMLQLVLAGHLLPLPFGLLFYKIDLQFLIPTLEYKATI
jgi:hypothetical protein